MSKKIKDDIGDCNLPTTFPNTFEVHGIKYMDGQTSRNRIHNLVANFRVRPTDVFLVGYPKSGNHWIKFVVSLVFANGDVTDKRFVEEPVNWLEFGSARKVDGRYETDEETFERFERWPASKPRVFTTHLHWDLLPKEVSKAKVIMVARNPRDVAVSFYHFMVSQHVYFQYDEDFQKFTDRFFDVGGPPFGCGSYYTFYSEYWSHRHDIPLLTVHYEDMKKNLVHEITRIARFVDVNLSNDVMTKIADACTFHNMRNHQYIVALDQCLDPSKSRFLRKGKSGDWKTFMTPKQISTFEYVERKWFESTTFRPKFYDNGI